LFERGYESKKLLAYSVIYSETSWEEVVNNRLPREIGKRNFHPRFNNWSILILGKVHLVVIEMKRNKKALVNVIKIPIVIPKIPAILFIPKSSGMDMYGIEKFHPPK
jgi:hypothetical protein